VELSCGALQDALVENELFGSVQGGHSQASRSAEGKVAAARHGTLFLDEVENLSLSAQAKLLQFLQSKEYYPVGANQPVRADVRIIAATNRDLEALVAERSFRQDLYYRIQVITIRLPALSERAEDIALLARHFCERARAAHKLSPVELSPASIRALETAVLARQCPGARAPRGSSRDPGRGGSLCERGGRPRVPGIGVDPQDDQRGPQFPGGDAPFSVTARSTRVARGRLEHQRSGQKARHHSFASLHADKELRNSAIARPGLEEKLPDIWLQACD
jgi:hypothetical protein